MKTRKQLERLGPKPPSWLMHLCEGYILTFFSKSFECGTFSLGLSKRTMESAINESAKLRFSVLTDARVAILHQKQTDEMCKVLEKEASSWPSREKSEASSEKKTTKAKKDKNKDILSLF